MRNKRPGTAPAGEPDTGEKRGSDYRLRALPGFRTAALAFVLTVVLGVGGTAAYAYWSKSTQVAIAGTTKSDLPPGTGEVSANPVLAVRPESPSKQACAALLSDLEMRPNNFADIRFSWTGGGATAYVVTVRSKDGSYAYDQTQTVRSPRAEFRFGRMKSDEYGKPTAGTSPFYTKYTVRVMPMNGNTSGDPLYFTYEYEHYKSNNCYWSEPTGASPVGSVAPLVCAAPVTVGGAAGYSDLGISWASSSGATSYSVTMVNPDRSYGGEVSVTGTSTSFRIMRPSPESDNAPYFATYSVRVQPMKGSQAGDPVYLKGYQFYTWGQKC